MEMSTYIIVLVSGYIIILTDISGGIYYLLTNTYPSIKEEFVRPVKYADEEERYSRPCRYVTRTSFSEIDGVEDLYRPKSFEFDNITVFFPEINQDKKNNCSSLDQRQEMSQSYRMHEPLHKLYI